jgi:hypothetical protein
MANQIVLNNIKATASIKNVVVPASTVNGGILVLGAQSADKTYASAAPVAVTDKGMVIVLEVPMSYEVEKIENDFVIATGAIARCYVPELGDVISIPVANVTATVALAVSKIVVPDAGQIKMECIDAFTGTEVVGYIIDELYTKAGVPMVKLRCIKVG